MGEWKAVKSIIPLDKDIKFKPMKDTFWIEELDIGPQMVGDIVIQSDWKVNATRLSAQGVHPRWGKVYAVADSLKDMIEVGDYVYLKHGCWTESFDFFIDNKIKPIWMIPKKSVFNGVMAIRKKVD